MRKAMLLAAGVLALGAAGCGGDDDEGGDQARTTQPPANTAERTTPTATTPSQGRRPIAISGVDFRFRPANVTARAGQVSFRLTNDGQAPHALEVEGRGVEEETRVINPGQQDTLTVDRKPGRYELYCPVGNHRQMGMEGTLTVR